MDVVLRGGPEHVDVAVVGVGGVQVVAVGHGGDLLVVPSEELRVVLSGENEEIGEVAVELLGDVAVGDRLEGVHVRGHFVGREVEAEDGRGLVLESVHVIVTKIILGGGSDVEVGGEAVGCEVCGVNSEIVVVVECVV